MQCAMQDGDNALRYAEFVAGLLYINGKIDPGTAARMAFSLFDKDKDGKIYRESLSRAVEEVRIPTVLSKTCNNNVLLNDTVSNKLTGLCTAQARDHRSGHDRPSIPRYGPTGKWPIVLSSNNV